MPAREPEAWSYDYSKNKPSYVTRFLWFAAGVDDQLLERCPRSEWAKYQGIGGVVFATAVLAWLSGGYAFYTVFSPKDDTALAGPQQDIDPATAIIAFILGGVWSMVIFNLDRFVVSSTGKGDGKESISWDEFKNALPRLLMAVMIGVTLSAPLEIRVMESEIEAILEQEQIEYERDLNESSRARYDGRKAELQDKLEKGQARLDESASYQESRRKEILAQREKLEMEAEGRSGTARAGRGPAWQDKHDNLERLQTELARDGERASVANARIAEENDRISADIKALDAEKVENMEANRRAANNKDGLMYRIQLAEKVSPVGAWMIRLLLMSIEVAPVLFKLMLTRGPYDFLDENERRLVAARAGVELEAIEIQSADHPAGEVDITEVYHQYEREINREKERMDVEESLARHALKEYANRARVHISESPGDYFAGEPMPFLGKSARPDDVA